MKNKIYCESCGEMFEAGEVDGIIEQEMDGFEDRYACCPMCGSTEIYDADTCEVCGEAMPPVSLRKYGVADCCDECAKVFVDELAELLAAHYSEKEQGYVASVLSYNMDEVEKRMDEIRAKKKLEERRAS